MGKSKMIFLLICLLLVPSLVDAQSLTNRERRYINSRVLTVIEEYERYATVHDDEAEYAFGSLFAHDGVPVTCDMIGFPSYLEQIPVSGYIKLMRAAASTVTMVIKDVRKGETTYSGGVWMTPVTFRKSISYIDNNGYAFSVDDFHGKDMEVSMTISYNPDSDACLIESVESKMDSEVAFPKGRFFIVNKPEETEKPDESQKFMNQLKVDGRELNYNTFGQAIMTAGMPEVNDIDVVVTVDTLTKGVNYDVVNFKFAKRNGRMKARYGIAPFGAYNVTAPAVASHKSSAMEAGLDFGVTWSVGKSAKMGFYGGAGISMSKLALSLTSPLNYRYTTSVFDGSQNKFKDLAVGFDISSATESLDFMDIYVPVYFEFEHKLGNHVLLSWNFGVKAYYNLQTRTTPYSMSGTIAIDDELTGINSVNFSQSYTQFISPVSYKRKPYDISAIANLGIDINLVKRRLYLMVKGGYEYGFTKSYVAQGKKFFDTSSRFYPAIYNPADGSVVAMHSFISNTSYHRQAIWLEVGFKFKM